MLELVSIYSALIVKLYVLSQLYVSSQIIITVGRYFVVTKK